MFELELKGAIGQVKVHPQWFASGLTSIRPENRIKPTTLIIPIWGTDVNHAMSTAVLWRGWPEVGDVQDRTLAFCLRLEHGFDRHADV